MKFRLLTPGPTMVPEETLLELAKPMVYHRGAAARKILAEVLADLKKVFVTENTILPLTCSGSGALEAALVNSVPAGKKAIVCSAGKFGERWRNIAQAFGIETVNVTAPYGKAIQPDQVEQALKAHPDAVAVCSTLSETSTGVGHDIEAFGKIVAPTPTLLLVDGISGIGAMECRTDAWRVDLCCAGSQKAFMLPPGLAFVSVSAKGWSVIERNPSPRSFYLNLLKARKSVETNDTPYTPAHTLIAALRVSLKRIMAEGIEPMWRRHALYAEASRAAFVAMGLEIFPERPNNALTVAKTPEGIDGNVLLETMEKRFGLKLGNGQDALKGKIIRLGHIGHVDQFDMLAAIAGLEITLQSMGHSAALGAGLTAAQRVFAR